MSYFLCLATPLDDTKLSCYFCREIIFKNVSSFPVGRATSGNNREKTKTYFLLINGYSTDLLDLGYRKTACSSYFIDGVHKILKDISVISFLVHFFRGHFSSEEVIVARKHFLTYQQFLEIFPVNVEENVRYIVKAQ